MRPESTMLARANGRSLALFALILLTLTPGRARGQDPLTLAVGAAAESGTVTVAPTLFVRAPFDDTQVISGSQLGWTTALGYERLLGPDTAFVLGFRGTPWRANLSDVRFQAGERTDAGTFEAAQIDGELGLRMGATTSSYADVRLAVSRPFVVGLAEATMGRWNTLQVGGRLRLGASWLRSDDPLRGRSDGLALGLDLRAFTGALPWLDGRVTARVGRRMGRLFLGGSLAGFHVTAADSVSQRRVGGSWDALGADALYGFPLGAFGLASGGIGSVRLDLRLVGALEVGLRGSALVHPDGVEYGGAAQLMFRIAGIDLICGVGLGRPDAFAPNGFAAVRGLWMF